MGKKLVASSASSSSSSEDDGFIVSDSEDDECSFIASDYSGVESESDNSESSSQGGESEGSSSQEEEALFPPESKFFNPNAQPPKPPSKSLSLQRKRVANGLYCSKCKDSKSVDSFSAVQRKVVEDEIRYCLGHTAASGFNRQAVVSVRVNAVDSDDEKPSPSRAKNLIWDEEQEQTAFKEARVTPPLIHRTPLPKSRNSASRKKSVFSKSENSIQEGEEEELGKQLTFDSADDSPQTVRKRNRVEDDDEEELL